MAIILKFTDRAAWAGEWIPSWESTPCWEVVQNPQSAKTFLDVEDAYYWAERRGIRAVVQAYIFVLEPVL